MMGKYLAIKGDMADLHVAPNIFNAFEKRFGGPPNTVVYNAHHWTRTNPEDPLSASIDEIEGDMKVNATGVYAAAAEAVLRFSSISSSIPKTFIYIGNKQAFGVIFPLMTSIGMGKNAAAHLMEIASMVYSKNSINFYYANERMSSGDGVGEAVSGEAHGEFLVEIASKTTQGPWNATFVKGTGYVEFAQ